MDKPVVVTQSGRQYIALEMVVTRVIRLNPGETPEQAMERFWDTDEPGSDFLEEACEDVRFLDTEDTLHIFPNLETARYQCNGDDDQED